MDRVCNRLVVRSIAVKVLPALAKFISKLGDSSGAQAKLLGHRVGGMPEGEQIRNLPVPQSQGPQPIGKITTETGLIGDWCLPIIDERIGPFWVVVTQGFDSTTFTSQKTENICAVLWGADAPAAANMLHRSDRDHRRELRGIFAASDETQETLKAGGHGLGNRFFTVNGPQMPEADKSVTLNGGLNGQETIDCRRHGTISSRDRPLLGTAQVQGTKNRSSSASDEGKQSEDVLVDPLLLGLECFTPLWVGSKPRTLHG